MCWQRSMFGEIQAQVTGINTSHCQHGGGGLMMQACLAIAKLGNLAVIESTMGSSVDQSQI